MNRLLYKVGHNFAELYRESIVTQSTVTIFVTATVCYMYISGSEVPNELVNVFMLILGFYFGGKSVLGKSKGSAK